MLIRDGVQCDFASINGAILDFLRRDGIVGDFDCGHGIVGDAVCNDRKIHDVLRFYDTAAIHLKLDFYPFRRVFVDG
jgi:hypothetical protein